MLINIDKLNLKVDDILNNIEQEKIYSYYLGQSISNNKLAKCCFHKDKDPSLGFYWSRNKDLLYYNCFSCGARGNIFEFVKTIKGCTFKESIQIIAEDLNLINNSKY